MDIPKSFRAEQGLEEKTEQLLIRPRIKKELEEPIISERFSIVYKNLNSEDMRHCNYPLSTLADMIIKFKSKNNRWYRVNYYNYDDYSPPKLQVSRERSEVTPLEEEKEEFIEVSKQIFGIHINTKRVYGPTFKSNYFTEDFEIWDKIEPKEIANLLDNFYKKSFDDVVVYEARFYPITILELEESNIPREKIRRTYPLGR